MTWASSASGSRSPAGSPPAPSCSAASGHPGDGQAPPRRRPPRRLRPDGADEAGNEDVVVADVGAGVRCVDHLVTTDVDADVMDGQRVGRVAREEDQVAGTHVTNVDVMTLDPLVSGEVVDREAHLCPCEQ